MSYYLGIDGGGSKTAALAGDDRAELGRAEGPSCKIQSVGDSAARAALQDVMARVCGAAGFAARDLRNICIGVSGASNPDIAERMRRFITEIATPAVEVVGDNVIALEAAFGRGPGVIVVAGTGSIAYGRNEEGKEARAGGFGPVISDEGSGTWIGKRAVYEVARSGNLLGAMARSIAKAWYSANVADIVSRANKIPPPDFAALFPNVLAACEANDQQACEVLHQAGRELARLAAEVVAELWSPPEPVIQVGLVGGVFANSEAVRDSFVEFLRTRHPSVTVNKGTVEPVRGALARARRLFAA